MQDSALKKLSPVMVPLLKDISVSGGRESYRTLARHAASFRNSLSSLADEQTSAPSIIWIVHEHHATTPYLATLSASHHSIQCFADVKEAQAKLVKPAEKPNLILVSSRFSDFITFVHDKHPEIELILSGADDITASIPLLQSRSHINQMVFEHAFDSIFMQKNLLSTVEKILSRNVFGLEKYLDHGVAIVDSVISGNISRKAALEQLARDMTQIGISNVLARKAHHLADELLMNAIYDAPTDPATGKARYNHLTRAVSVELEPREFARFRYGFDGTVLALSIDDPFGALPRDIILKYLQSCFEGQFGKWNEKEGKGGGGTGLYQILSTADVLVCNVHPGKRTEIIALVNIHERLPIRTHGFHYFTSQTAAFDSNPVSNTLIPEVITNLQSLYENPSKKEAVDRIGEILTKIQSRADKVKPSADDVHPSALLISANKRHQRTFKASLGVSQVESQIVESLDEVGALESTPALIIVDDTICDAIPELTLRYPKAKIAAYNERNAGTAIEELMKHPGLAQVMSLDLPKTVLQKLLLSHMHGLLYEPKDLLRPYLSYGATVKKLEAGTLAKIPGSHEEMDKRQQLQRALSAFRKSGELRYGFDPHLFVLNIVWQETLSRTALLELLKPDSENSAVQTFYANAHALIVSSNGLNHELSLIRFQSHEEVHEPFLYTFFRPLP